MCKLAAKNIPKKINKYYRLVAVLFLLGGFLSCQEGAKPKKSQSKPESKWIGLNINQFRLTLAQNMLLEDSTSSDTLALEWGLHRAETPVFKAQVDLEEFDILLDVSEKMALSISDEGTSCELTNWKVIVSKYDNLKIGKNGQFELPINEAKEHMWPATFDTMEFREAVKKECPEKYYPLIINASNPNEYPISVAIVQKTLRFRYKEKGKSQWKERFLVFNIPLGC